MHAHTHNHIFTHTYVYFKNRALERTDFSPTSACESKRIIKYDLTLPPKPTPLKLKTSALTSTTKIRKSVRDFFFGKLLMLGALDQLVQKIWPIYLPKKEDPGHIVGF